MKEYTLNELIDGLNSGKWTSKDLVEMYLTQIEKYDMDGPCLNSIAEINPDVYAIAEALDIERKEQGPRSLLHGIPIVIKDNINTHDKMHTTASSNALSDLYAPNDAFIVKKLRDAGVILLGKTNLSEFAYFMSYDKMPSGYGSRNGQVKNPYNEKIDPLGSSTGSAVAVAANLIPVSIGTETNGSLIAPAQNNSIVSMKPTLGLVSRTGIIPISHNQDTAGPMARNVKDLAILFQAMIGTDLDDVFTLKQPKKTFDFIGAAKKNVKGLRIGIISFSNYPYEEEELKILEEAKSKFEQRGVTVTNITLEALPMKNDQSLLYEFKACLNYYLSTVRGHTKMTSLKDIIEFNKLDPIKNLKYGQSIFEESEKTKGTLTESSYLKIRKELLLEANRFSLILEEKNLDCLISTRRSSYAPVAGNPCICVPAKALTDLVPRSLVFIGKHFDDELLISLASSYEDATQYRIQPTL